VKVFNWHVPGTRDKGAEISDLEAQAADLRRALAEAREELRQETLRLTEQVDALGTDLNEAEGDVKFSPQELQALRGPVTPPESFERDPSTLHTMPVSNQQDQPQDPVAAWQARWPNHCKACGGWGVFRRSGQDPCEIAEHESGEITLRLCDALPPGSCHRCGAPDGIDVADELSRGCRYCGWDYDDGVPEPGGPGKEL
jgi:hypothetical protein